MIVSQVWVIEERQVISAIAGDYVSWSADLAAGVFTDYEPAAEEVYRRNQASHRRLEEQLEQEYQERLGAWRTSAAEHRVLVAAGLRSAQVPALMEPQRSRCIHTDAYRVSRSLQMHSRA